MKRQSSKQKSFAALLDGVAKPPFSQLNPASLAELAKHLWYAEVDLMPQLQQCVASNTLDAEQKRRALYLVDSLRRFSCVSDEKAMQLKHFLAVWGDLKPKQQSPQAADLVVQFKLDKLASEWGLNEDVTAIMMAVLPFQTRHYASAQSEGADLRLSMADQVCLAQALLSPPKVVPALERAFARRSKLLRAE